MLAYFRSKATVKYADPLHAGRHPFQTFMLALCVISGIPLLLGEPRSTSVEALLPGWVATAWGLSLTVGAVLGLVGSYWPRKNYATALTIERIGLDITGPAAVLYAVIVFTYGGWGSSVAACIIVGFGASCLVRAGDIGTIIKRAIPGPSPAVQREDGYAEEPAGDQDPLP